MTGQQRVLWVSSDSKKVSISHKELAAHMCFCSLSLLFDPAPSLCFVLPPLFAILHLASRQVFYGLLTKWDLC